ncbi:MAG TPA: DUF4149 domain-containing protein [Verrucomicrobiae bacterium]|nr:DUF4149 domain-containing protein [Verrucomicrobiae bacterium]
MNAAIWFGAAIFFTVAVGPAIFSPEMKQVFGEGAFPYYSGAVALVVLKRYFILQQICGAIALLHLFAERLYLGRPWSRFILGLLLVIFGLGLIGGFLLQPKMRELRHTMYYGATQEQKETAHRAFAGLHGISQGANLIILAGLLVYLLRVSKPPESARYGTLYQIP